MKPHERCWVRLPLDGAYNVRELGGYPTVSGGQTAYHRFLRADGLSMLSRHDQRFLYDYGVRAIIDLRDESEVAQSPDCTISPDVAYTNIPLLSVSAASPEELADAFSANDMSLETVYRMILENYEGVRACFRFMAEAPEGCVLFHCAVGKDRTGILAMLLLSLAGVDKWDIVANYMQTRPNLMRDEVYYGDWNDPTRSMYQHLMESDPSLIEYAYDLVEFDHGDVENYLLECGVPDEDVAAVRRRLVWE